ncbi:MAG: hypothetical protein GQ564_11795 [Bacteroidales bacterium]|nr:hypothetical protein [Bacteroidales bacterium]
MKKLLILLSFISVLMSCSDEDESGNAEIIDMSITAMSSSDLLLEDISIESENSKILIFLNNDLRDHAFPISLTTDVKLSSGAKTSSFLNSEISFNEADQVISVDVEAEDGTLKTWSIFLIHHQIQNSSFEDWYTNVGMNGVDYTEIGNSAVESIWATANMGTSMYSVYGTKPLIVDSEKYVKIETFKSSSIPIPIAAGTLFIGRFDLAGAISNPTNPKKATKFGSSFIFSPKSFKVKYNYQAGDTLIQGEFNNPTNIFGGFTTEIIEGEEDKCAIYAILESRTEDTNTEVARAELYSETTSDNINEVIVDFNYTSTLQPTHISVVFSSSIDGDLWKGAAGSTLLIEEFELLYDL